MNSDQLSNNIKIAKSKKKLPGSLINYLILSVIGAWWLGKQLFMTPPGREIEI